jgi:alpha-tubulin suppressor-like RCC1 family protein
MGRTAVSPSMVLVALVACVAGCAEKSTGVVKSAGPALDPLTSSLPALIVSEPLHGPAPGSGSANASGVGSPVRAVYVSLPPGSVAAGVEATIRDQASGALVHAVFANGGFDPVAVSAKVGDTLVVEIARTGSADPIRAMRVVMENRPPVVVRTDPPPAQADVPLNSIMVVVFSLPIDSATLQVGSVQLWRDTTPVAGSVRFSDATQVKAEFHPDSVLASGTAYRLVISQAIADVNGLKLDSPVTVPFTTTGTASATGALAFVALSAGANHSCGVTASGAAYCWGDNTYGTLGDGTTTSSSTPVRVAGGIAFAQISAGWIHTCAVTAAGDAYCWGNNDAGQLGDGTTAQRTTPVPVAGGLRFLSVSTGGAHTCAVTTETIIVVAFTYCWGSNSSGQIGNGSAATAFTPTLVPGVSAQFLSAGRSHTCVVENQDLADGWCWGANDRGQLDDGTTTGRTTAVTITMLPCGPPGAVCAFETVSAGASHSCAEASGLLFLTYAWYCWGANDNGQLGDATTVDRSSPVIVGGGMQFAPGGVSAGGQHTCGTTSAGVAYCWGLNKTGQIGDGTTTQRTSPVAVAGGLRFLSVSAGKDSHTCGLTAPGDVYCWGANTHGQLGNGTTNGSTLPVRVVVRP